MEIIQITKDNLDLVNQFTKNELSHHFRYFKTRKIEDCINNHKYTIVGLVNDIVMAYAHIDYDEFDKKNWLGICILEKYQNQGFGKIIMTNLLDYCQNNKIELIYLSVDNDNKNAIALYKNYDFKIETTKDNIIYMCKINKIDNILLPVSYGEAFDKLSILEIKLDKIKDIKRKQDVQTEYDTIKQYILPLMSDTVKYYYEIMKEINLKIWIMQDVFREINDDNKKNKLCNEIILDNDRRFRVKNKINNFLNSNLKEQKGYNEKKCMILIHMGLGDNFTCNGLVRYYSTLYDKVVVPVKKNNIKNVRDMFSDDKTIELMEVESDRDFSITYGCSIDKFRQITSGYDVIFTGFHNYCFTQKEPTIIPFCFYSDANTPYSEFWDYYHIPTLKESEELYNEIKLNNIDKYIVIHTKSSAMECFTVEQIEKHFNICRQSTFIINLSNTVYKPGDKFYELSMKSDFKSVLSYKKIIENADLLVMCDSSFFCMSMNLDIKTDKCYYVTRSYDNYDDYGYIYNDEYKSKRGINRKRFNKLIF
jgi:ribosomal protein S18 acetylase RimI-like enzyme